MPEFEMITIICFIVNHIKMNRIFNKQKSLRLPVKEEGGIRAHNSNFLI